MKRFLQAVAAGAFALSGGPVLAQDSDNPMDLVRSFRDAQSAADWEAAQTTGEALLAHDRMTLMPDGYRASIHHELATSYAHDGDYESAQAHWAEAEALGTARRDIVWTGLSIALMQDQAGVANTFFTEMDTSFPDQRNALRIGQILELIDLQHGEGDHSVERDILDRVDANYTPSNPFTSLGTIQYRRVRSLVEQGEIDAAMELLPAMTSASGARRLRVLNLFAPLWEQPGFDRLTNQREATLDLLALSEQHIEDYPDHLEPIIDRMSYLRDLGRGDEASELATRTWHRLRAEEGFEDFDDQLIWFLNAWGYTEMELGNIAFGQATLERGAQFNESGGANVSQVINLALLELDRGEDRAALDRLADMEERGASDYGWTLVHTARACAAFTLGEDDIYEASLAWVEAHPDTVPWARFEMLACLGREDDAATLMIELLSDPDHAEDTLIQLQPGQPRYPDPAFTRYQAILSLQEQLTQRPEVQAAIAQVGRLEYVDLTQD